MPTPGVAFNWTQSPSTGGLGLDFTGGAEDVGDFDSSEPCTENFETQFGNNGALFIFADFNLQSGFTLETFEHYWGCDGRFAFDEDDAVTMLDDDFFANWPVDDVDDLTGYHEAALEDFEANWGTTSALVPGAETVMTFGMGAVYEDFEVWVEQMLP